MSQQKVILVGNSSSGKTSICRQLMGQPSKKDQPPTLGVEVHFYYTPMCTYSLWDCGGQHRGLGSGYYHGATMAFVFHGGPHYQTPQAWEQEVKMVAPNVQVYHVYGSLEEKLSIIRKILA